MPSVGQNSGADAGADDCRNARRQCKITSRCCAPESQANACPAILPKILIQGKRNPAAATVTLATPSNARVLPGVGTDGGRPTPRRLFLLLRQRLLCCGAFLASAERQPRLHVPVEKRHPVVRGADEHSGKLRHLLLVLQQKALLLEIAALLRRRRRVALAEPQPVARRRRQRRRRQARQS